MFLGDTLLVLGAFMFVLAAATPTGLLLPCVSVFGGVPWFVFVLEVDVGMILLLPLFVNGFSFSSAGNLLGAELLLECVFATTLATTGLPLAAGSLASNSAAVPVHPQLLLIALGPAGSGNLPADVLHLVPEAEPGRAPLAVPGLAIANAC